MPSTQNLASGISENQRDYEGDELANVYNVIRPEYPEEVRTEVLSCLRRNRDLGVCQRFLLDVGCGGGKSTKLFAEDFDQILGIDISQSQIDLARKNVAFGNVKFQVVYDNLLPVPNNSTDLVLCGLSLHYLNAEVFLKECDRVLVPGGVLACLIYDAGKLLTKERKLICDYAPKDSAFKQLCREFNLNCGSDEAALDSIHTHYEKIFRSITNLTKRRIHITDIEVNYTVKKWLQFLSTVAGYMKKQHPDPSRDPLNIFRSGFAGLLHEAGLKDDDDTEFILIFEYFAMIVEKTKDCGIV